MDTDFLSIPMRWSSVDEPDPVNVYDVLSDAWRETRVDKTLVFFLDPGERHGMGSLVIDALLATLDGAPLIDANGVTTTFLNASEYQGSGGWEVATQVDYIDVLATNSGDGLAIVLENKIGHLLDNPLSKYARRALDSEGVSRVLVAVLAPEERPAPFGQDGWLSRSITYVQLAQAIRRAPAFLEYATDPIDRNQRRSIDLLLQFIEKRTGGASVGTSDSGDSLRLDEWRTFAGEHRAQLDALANARKDVRALLKRRRERIEGPIADRIADALLQTDTQTAGGGGGDWQQVEYHFTDVDWSVGLCFTAHPDYPPVFVYDNPGGDPKRRRRQALNLSLAESDEVLTDAFVSRVREILEEVTGDRSSPARGEGQTLLP